MTTGKDAVQETIDRVHEAIAKVDRLAHMRDSTNTSTNTITFAHGTTTVVVCIVVAVASVFLSLSQAARIATLERKLDRVEDYQMTTYMLIPGLREQVETAIKARKEVK